MKESIASTANHILCDYQNHEAAVQYKQMLAELLASGKTYEDIFTPDGMKVKFIRMWNEPSFMGNIILSLRRFLVRRNGMYLKLKSIHNRFK